MHVCLDSGLEGGRSELRNGVCGGAASPPTSTPWSGSTTTHCSWQLSFVSLYSLSEATTWHSPWLPLELANVTCVGTLWCYCGALIVQAHSREVVSNHDNEDCDTVIGKGFLGRRGMEARTKLQIFIRSHQRSLARFHNTWRRPLRPEKAPTGRRFVDSSTWY